MPLSSRLRAWARGLKRETYALYLASRDPRVPLHAKLLAAVVVAYALSPIDLIPDFIPILGQLDDLILVPLGILIVIRMVPAEVLAECRQRAAALTDRPPSRGAVLVIVAVWLVVGVLVGWGAYCLLVT